MVDHESQCHSCDEQEEFGELLKYTGAGFAAHDRRSTRSFWIPPKRTRSMARSHASGEGESLLEGIYALRQRMRGSVGSMAEAYG